MAIGSPPIPWDLKHTGELWVYIGTPLPNPSGNTGVMVCVMCVNNIIVATSIAQHANYDVCAIKVRLALALLYTKIPTTTTVGQ